MMLFESERRSGTLPMRSTCAAATAFSMDILDGNEARQMEPALSPRIIRRCRCLTSIAPSIRGGCAMRLPRISCVAAARSSMPRCAGFEIGGEGPTKIVTDHGPMDVETVVLAAGVWSRPLAKQPGTSVPLEAERGYHVMFSNLNSACAVPWSRPTAACRWPTCTRASAQPGCRVRPLPTRRPTCASPT